MVGLVLLIAGTIWAPAHAELPDRAAVQNRIESGDDLGSRARKVLFRARTRMEEGNALAAIGTLDGWLDGHPERDRSLLRFERALARMNLDQPDSALLDLRRAVALEPRFARAWLTLGEVAYGQQAYAVAAEAFAKGYGLTPDPRPEILHYQGVCLLLAGQAQQAAAVLAELLRVNRAQAELDWYRALIAADLESPHPGVAAPFLDHLVEDFAADPQAWDLAASYAASGQHYRSAAVFLTIADYLQPLAAGRLDQLGDLYAACGVPLEAARIYERALAARPATTETDSAAVRRGREDQERLASAWLAAHRPGRARAALQAAVKTDPDFGRGYLLLGYSSLELGLEEQARQELRRAQTYPKQAVEAGRILKSLETE